MFSRGGARSSEGAKAAVEAERKTAKLQEQVEQLHNRTERAEKKAKVATDKASAAEAKASAAAAESSALFSGNWRDPRLSFQGRVLARSLNEKAQKEIERETRRAEVAKREAERVGRGGHDVLVGFSFLYFDYVSTAAVLLATRC
jgi:hypothetical protein